MTEIDLSTRVLNHLENADLETVWDVLKLSAEGDEGLLMLEGIGPKSLAEIKQSIEALELEKPEQEAAAQEAVTEEVAAKVTEAEVAVVEAAEAEAIVEVAASKAEVEPAPAAEETIARGRVGNHLRGRRARTLWGGKTEKEPAQAETGLR